MYWLEYPMARPDRSGRHPFFRRTMMRLREVAREALGLVVVCASVGGYLWLLNWISGSTGPG